MEVLRTFSEEGPDNVNCLAVEGTGLPLLEPFLHRLDSCPLRIWWLWAEPLLADLIGPTNSDLSSAVLPPHPPEQYETCLRMMVLQSRGPGSGLSGQGRVWVDLSEFTLDCKRP